MFPSVSQCLVLLSTPSHLSRKRWAKRYVLLGEVSSSDHYRGFLYQSFEQNDFLPEHVYRSVGEDVLHCIRDWVFYWWH